MSESTDERAGGLGAISPLLGTRAAQSAVDALARNVERLNDGLSKAVNSLQRASRSSGGNSWNGNSNFGHGRPNGGGSTPSGGSKSYRPGQYWDETFLGGGGGAAKPPTQSGNRGNGGWGSKVAFGVSAFAGAGVANLNTMVTSNTTAQMLGRTSTMPWNDVRSTFARNNVTATSSIDAAAAAASIGGMGFSAGSAGWNAAMGYNRNFGLVNPGMSSAEVAAAQSNLTNGNLYNYFAARGIRTIGSGGRVMDPGQLANQMIGRIAPGAKWTKSKSAYFTSTRGQGGIALQGLRQAGASEETINAVKAEMDAQTTAMANGSSFDQYRRAVSSGDTKALERMGISTTDATRLKTTAAKQRNVEDNMANGFSKGLDHATDALSAFADALNGVTHGPLGDALGYGQGLAGTLASGGGSVLGGFLGTKLAGKVGRSFVKSGGLSRAASGIGRTVGSAGEMAATVGSSSRLGAALFGASRVAPLIGVGMGSAPGQASPLQRLLGHETADNGSTSYGRYHLTGTDGISGGANTAGGGAGGGGGSKKGVAPQSAGGATAAKVIGIAMRYIGVPYKWGGTTPKGFDCSGLMQYAFGQAAVHLPRTSQEQARAGSPVSIRDVRPGDLVFPSDAHHVALVVGPGKIIEAPRTGLNVRVTSLRSDFTFARRVLASVGAVGAITGDTAQSVSGDNRNQKAMPATGGNAGSVGAGTSEAAIVMAGLSSMLGVSSASAQQPSPADGANGTNGATSGGGPAPTGNVASWIKSALGVLHLDYNKYGSAISTIIQHESGGNPRAINKWDSNWKAGHPSKGLMQTIDSTFNAHKLPGHGDIWNPVDNIIAATRYAISRYGTLDNVPGVKSLNNGGAYKGYAVGATNVDVDQIAKVHKGETILDAESAENFRNALKGNNPTKGLLGGGGGRVDINFHAGAVVLHASGPMNDSQASDFAKKVVAMIANDTELKKIAEGV